MKDKVLLVYGGKSVEHDISIITALQVMKNFPKEYDLLPLYIDKKGIWWNAENLDEIEIYSNFQKYAKKRKQATLVLGENKILLKKGSKFSQSFNIFSVVNCCHGNIGEDGALQGVFEACDMKQSSSSVVSSALCMDKAFMKDVLKANDIASPKYVVLNKCTYDENKDKIVEKIEEKVNFPLIVKPANLGSSIGISVCNDIQEIFPAIQLAFEFDNKIVVEEMVDNLREFNCACFEYKNRFVLSKVNEIKNKGEIYSFEDKYLSSVADNQDVDETLTNYIRKLTQKLYKLFECQGIVRVDFLYDSKSKILYVNEINTIPGSLAFYLFKDISFKDLIISMIEQSKIKYDQEQELIKSYDSEALNIFEKTGDFAKK